MMKAKMLFVSFLLVWVTITHAQQLKHFTISGTISGEYSDDIVFAYFDGKKSIKDTIQIDHGIFIAKGVITEPNQAYLHLTGTSTVGWLYLDEGDIEVRINAKKQLNDEGSSFYVVNLEEVTGSSSHDLQNHYRKTMREINNSTHSIEVKNEKKFDLVYELASKYPSHTLIFNILREAHFLTFDRMRKITSVIDAEKLASDKYLNKFINHLKVTEIGTSFEYFSQEDKNGQLFHTSDLKGKYILVDFWASWCSPCRAENPTLVEQYTKFHNKGLEIVGVSLDSNRQAWLKAIEKDGLPWHHVSDLEGDDNAIALKYYVNAIPFNFLVDRNGKIVAKDLRGEELITTLEKIFSEID